MGRVSRLGANLLVSLASGMVAVLLAEGGLRLFRPVQYLKPPDPPSPGRAAESLYRPSTIDGLSYEMVPNRDGIFEGMHVRTNACGLRGPAPVPESSHPIRLAAIGDSFTFGFGVDEKDTYPSLLQGMLNTSETLRAVIPDFIARRDWFCCFRKCSTASGVFGSSELAVRSVPSHSDAARCIGRRGTIL